MSDGLFIEDHAKAVGLKHDVFLLFVHSSDRIKERRVVEYDDSKGFQELKIYFKSVKTGIPFLNKMITGFQYLSVQRAGYNRIKEVWGEPDICHVHVLLRTSFLARRLKRKRKIPYVVSEHWSGYDPAVGGEISGFRRRQLIKTLRKADAVTAVSTYLLNHINSLYRNRITQVIANAIDESVFTYQPKEIKEVKQLLHVSTLSADPKNFHLILQAIAELWKQRKDFFLNVLGDGPEKEYQVELARNYGILDAVVRFHGHVDKDEVSNWFQKSDLFVLFSRNETQSCVLLESFLTGTPAIVPNVGGAKELVSEYNGILVERNNVEQLVKLLNAFLDGEYQFDGERMHSESLQYGYKKIGNLFDSLYQDVLK